MSVDLTDIVEAVARAGYESLWTDTVDWNAEHDGFDIPTPLAWDDLTPDVRHRWRESRLDTVAAAAPLIEAQVRKQIVAEIAEFQATSVAAGYVVTVAYALSVAQRIAGSGS